MTKRNSSQRVQDVIDRLSDLNVRELDALAHSLSRYNNQTLHRVLDGVVVRAGKFITFPVAFGRGGAGPTDPKDSGAPGLEQGGEDELPIIRAARENGNSIAP